MIQIKIIFLFCLSMDFRCGLTNTPVGYIGVR